MEAYREAKGSGSNPITTREPSSGGNGMRLNTPKITLIRMSWAQIYWISAVAGMNLRTIERTKAKRRFATGPLNPTQIMSLFGFPNAQ